MSGVAYDAEAYEVIVPQSNQVRDFQKMIAKGEKEASKESKGEKDSKKKKDKKAYENQAVIDEQQVSLVSL